MAAFKVDEKGRLLTVESGQSAILLGVAENIFFASGSNCSTAAFLSSNGSIFVIFSLYIQLILNCNFRILMFHFIYPHWTCRLHLFMMRI